MKYRISHTTRYQADEAVSLGKNRACLMPRRTRWQECDFSRLVTLPPATVSDRRQDYFGNTVSYFSFERGYQTLEIRSLSHVAVRARELPDLEQTVNWESCRVLKSGKENAGLDIHAVEMTLASPCIDSADEPMREYANQSFAPKRPILSGLQDLLARFSADFEFDSTATTIYTPVREVFQQRKGVCQDFAHLLIAFLRSQGLSARYVSGYIRTHPPKGQPRLRGADASHAWVSVCCGDLGWVDIDPTNKCFVSDEHVTVAWGRDYSDVVPVKGVVIGAGSHVLNVSVDVEPDDEVTREE